VQRRANSTNDDVAHLVPLQRSEHLLRLEAQHSGRLRKGPCPVGSLFESKHLEQATQSLARRGREHLGDLVLPGDGFLAHAGDPGISG